MSRIRQSLCLGLLALAACSPALDWREYRADDGGFAVLLPQKPGRAERRIPTPAGEVTMHMMSARVGEHVLAAGFADFGRVPDAKLVEAMRDALLRNVGGQLKSEKMRGAAGSLDREIAAVGRAGQGKDERDVELRARLVVSGTRYVQLVSIGSPGSGVSEADVEMFLASYKPG